MPAASGLLAWNRLISYSFSFSTDPTPPGGVYTPILPQYLRHIKESGEVIPWRLKAHSRTIWKPGASLHLSALPQAVAQMYRPTLVQLLNVRQFRVYVELR